MRPFASIIILFVFSCNSTQEKMNRLNGDTLIAPSNIIEEANRDSIVFQEEMNIESKAYLSILPSERWIDSMRAIQGEDDWNEVVFDNQHYIHEAQTYLESKGYIEMKQPEGKIWSYTRPNGLVKTINSDTLTDKWGLIIFNRNNDPIFYDGTESAIDLDTL